MTVVVAVKVFDGIVLAADSATTMAVTAPAAQVTLGSAQVIDYQVYNNADKIVQLHRDLPIGLATWGGGQIESASISTLAKDLRRRFMGLDDANANWKLDRDTYTISGVVDKAIDFMYGELFKNVPAIEAQLTGFMIAGYSAARKHPELWEFQLEDVSVRPAANQIWDEDGSGWRATGQADVVARLFNGYTPSLLTAVQGLVPAADQPALTTAFDAESRVSVVAAMPFADAINLAKFLVETTIGYMQYVPGSNTVGGPVDVAGISRHEGFKWVNRKHYYPVELNPRRPHDHDQ